MKKILSNKPLKSLGLNIRIYNSLRRVGVDTVGGLLDLIENGTIGNVRNLGEKSLNEISMKMGKYEVVTIEENEDEILDAYTNKKNDREETSKEKSTIDEKSLLIFELSEKVNAYREIFFKLTEWQNEIIKKQIEQGLLHDDIICGGRKLSDLLVDKDLNQLEKFNLFSTMLNPFGISDEINVLLDDFSSRDIKMLLKYYGFTHKTLDKISKPLDITRERVRQILGHMERKICEVLLNNLRESSNSLEMTPFPRIQTALHHAEDMGLEITFHKWSQYLVKVGLIGNCQIKGVDNSRLIELSLSICNLMEKKDIEEFIIPNNLRYAILLAAAGQPHTPAKIEKIQNTLPNEIKKEIRRHARFTGAVNAKWLSHEIDRPREETKEILEALGYSLVSNDWYSSKKVRSLEDVTRSNVFERTINKMIMFCGPLKTEDFCSGVQHAVCRTSYPAAPSRVMEVALELRGYKKEDELWSMEAEFNEKLNSGEKIIISCLDNIGPVLHHSEIAQAFIDSELSFASIHATLNRSPLFKKIEYALYKLRGTTVTYADIERAKNEGDMIPVNLKVIPGRTGVINIYGTLGLLPVGTGVFLSESLPKLSGEWLCKVAGKELGEVQVTDNEIRGLLGAFENLGCEVQDRVWFSFNTWDRTISIEKLAKYEN